MIICDLLNLESNFPNLQTHLALCLSLIHCSSTATTHLFEKEVNYLSHCKLDTFHSYTYPLVAGWI